MTPETIAHEKSLLEDPKVLLADNGSLTAKQRIDAYYRAKKSHELTQIEGCSDARANAGAFIDDSAIEFHPSIAAAGDKEFIKHTVIHPGVAQIMVLQHFDGSTVAPGKYPKGCGGLGVKEQRITSRERPMEKGILGFVDRRIRHPGIYNQSYASALEVAVHTDKPVLAGALDHITGFIHPFVVILDEGRTIHASVPMGKFTDPFFIYRDGIPDLAVEHIPESFHRILKSNQKRVADLTQLNPDIDTTQKIQDPSAIVMTTSLLPTPTRYPTLFENPNTNFGIGIPIVKTDGHVTGLHSDGFEDVMAQLEYPIGNAVQAQSGHGGHGFHRTHRLIIETPSIELSRKIGKTVRSESWMGAWLRLPNNQIWVAQVLSGRTQKAEVFH